MNKYILSLLVLAFVSCEIPEGNDIDVLPGGGVAGVVVGAVLSEDSEWISEGDEITAEGAMTTAQMLAVFETGSGFEGKVKTTIKSCCQKKGCWMKVDLGDGEEMRVTFKDYGFFVPLNSTGMEVIMQGSAFADTVDVDMLQHYAEDAGKSQEEIDAITEPEMSLSFEATGVLLKGKAQ